VLGLQQAYLNRDRLRNFPHTDRRFNEARAARVFGQESFATSDAALFDVCAARAVSEHVLQNPSAMKSSKSTSSSSAIDSGSGKGFTRRLRQARGGWTLILYMIDQDPERRIRFRVALAMELRKRGSAREPDDLRKVGGVSSKSCALRRLLEILEAELGRSDVSDAYQSYLVQIEKGDPRGAGEEGGYAVRMLLAMGRLLEQHQKAIEADRSASSRF